VQHEGAIDAQPRRFRGVQRLDEWARNADDADLLTQRVQRRDAGLNARRGRAQLTGHFQGCALHAGVRELHDDAIRRVRSGIVAGWAEALLQ
jgi:hypothetical protein